MQDIERNEEYILCYSMYFTTKDELLTYIRKYSTQKGFGISIKRTKKLVKGEVNKMIIMCHLSGEYSNKLKINSSNAIFKGRKTSSKKVNCMFEIRSHKTNSGWCIYWYNDRHNHAMSNEESKIILNNRLSTLQVETIDRITRSSISPISIAINENSETQISMKNIQCKIEITIKYVEWTNTNSIFI